MNIEELQQELQVVSDRCKGFHKEVADNSGISYNYLNRIKNPSYKLSDSEENKLLLKSIIKNYRRAVQKRIREYETISSEIPQI